MNVTRVTLAVDSTQVRRASTELHTMQRSGQRAEQTVTRMGRNMETAARLATQAFVALGAAISVRELVQYSDAWTQVNNQLRQVVDSESELVRVRTQLFNTSQDTNSELETTVRLYTEMFRATRDLGTSQATVADVTRTINNLFKAGGKAASETAGAVRQLSQGLASGALRGDEFNSVAEGAPRILDALAQATGMARGELREFAAQGQITAELLISALSDYSDEAQRLADLTEETFGQKMTKAQNNMAAFAGESNTLNSSIGALGDGVVAISENLDTLTTVGTGLAVVMAGRLAGAAASATAGLVAQSAAALKGTATMNIYTGALVRTTTAQNAMAIASRGAAGALGLVGGPVGAAVIAAGGLVYFATRTDTTIERAKELEQQLRDTAGAFDELTAAQARVQRLEIQDSLQQATEELDKLESKFREMQERLSSRGRGDEVPDTFIRMEQAIEAAEGRVGTFSEALRRLDGIISGSGYFDEGGDPFDLPPGLVDGAEKVQKVSEAVEQQIALLREHNALLQSGMDVEQAAQQIQDRKLEMQLREKDATEQQIETYLRLQEAIRGATEEARKYADEQQEEQNRIEGLEQQLDLFRSMADPMHELNSQLETLKDIFDAGLIDKDEFEELKAALMEAAKSAGGIGAELAKAGESARKSFRIVQRSMDEGSQSYRNMEVAIQAANVAAAVGAVLNQGMGDPYTAFVRMAAMAASVASLGYGVGNISGGSDTTAQDAQASQGAGTVLGMADEKSESIAKATEITADAANELVGINRGMLVALRAMQQGIEGASGDIARSAGMSGFAGENRSWTFAEATGGSLAEELRDPMKALFGIELDFVGDWVHEILGGSSEIINQGVGILGGTISQMINDTLVFAFQDVESQKHFLDDKDVSRQARPLSEAASQQFQLIFSSMADAVRSGGEALGLATADVSRRIEEFRVQAQEISLQGLTAEDQQAELESVFSSIFDGLVGSVLPFIDQFQMVGEGLGETLVRVATNVQVTEEAITRLGFTAHRAGAEQFARLSTELVEAAGGIENFLSGMSSFVDKFATEEHKLATVQSDMQRAFERVNLEIPETRDGMWELMQSLDAGTEAGRAQIAALLELSDVADDYYKQLDKAQQEAMKAERERLRLVEDARQQGMRAVSSIMQTLQAELAGISGALSGLRGTMDPTGVRSRAVDTLRDALLTGDLSGTGQAAQLAAQINAEDFDSAEAFRREQARTVFLLDSLEREGKQQISTAEQSLNALENIDSGIEEVANILERLSREIVFNGEPVEIPQFARGGYHSGGLRIVGENGPELEMTGPSFIANNSELRQALASNAELLRELQDIKRYIRQTTKNTGETRDKLTSWDRLGLPEERELA